MKIFIILCLLLGFLHIQVDGSPMNSSYENENTFEGQIKSLMSKIEHIILETNNSMVKVHDQILEHLDERYTLMKKQIWHLCPSGTVTNSTGCLNVTETDADDIQERFLSVKNDIRACSKDDPRHLKKLLKLIKKWKKEPSLFAHERNISASHDEWPQLMYEKQYHEKNSWIENMIRMESHYIQCIAENIRVLQRPWNIILSVIIPFPPNDELYKNFTAVKLINDTKDSWVGKTMRQTFLDMKHIAEVTYKSVVEIHNDDSIFVENQINRLEKQIVSAFSNQTTLQNSLAPKNITQFIERTVSMVKKNISQCFNEFVEKKNSEMKSYREGEEKMVGMSVDDANIPKDLIGQQNWLYTGLYTVKLDVRESMNDSKVTYIQCMKSKIDFLKHLSEPSAVNELIADSSPLTEDE